MALPKTQKQLEKLLDLAWQRGHEMGLKDGRALGVEDASKKFDHAAKQTRLQALEAMTKLASTYGQLMQTLTRAMESEAGQL